MKKITATALAMMMFFAALAVCASSVRAGEKRAKAVFAVHCYDVGKATLERIDGVISVERGWRGFTEINTVEYDPDKVTVKQMEDALKEANTYRETISAD